MNARLWVGAALATLLVHGIACAAEVVVDVTDARGHALADAVVELAPVQAIASEGATGLPLEAIIDQRHETFLPLVTLIGKGGHVIFTNSDATMHQVYSFSPIRQFAFEIDEGERSQPVIFARPGVAAIGCNIHDHMITYVYVAQWPWAAISDATGHAKIAEAPPGRYRATVWQPQLVPGSPRPSFNLLVKDTGASATIALSVASANPSKRKQMHMQMY